MFQIFCIHFSSRTVLSLLHLKIILQTVIIIFANCCRLCLGAVGNETTPVCYRRGDCQRPALEPTVPTLFCPGQDAMVVANPGYSPKLQALVYEILPSTTAIFSYAIWSRKLSANEQFFVDAQTAVSLLQTTQIKQGVSFIVASKVYTRANKTTIVSIETELLFLPGVDALGCFYGHISTESFGGS